MIEIMEKISDANENVMESLRKIYIEKNLIKKSYLLYNSSQIFSSIFIHKIL